MVVYYHTISTDANPQHNKCPKGADSWCKYQQSLALKVTPPEHLRDDDPKRLIPLRLTEYVKPIFERLCSRELLAKCVLGAAVNIFMSKMFSASSVRKSCNWLVRGGGGNRTRDVKLLPMKGSVLQRGLPTRQGVSKLFGLLCKRASWF